jgi:HEAT repeat protein
MVRSRAVPLSLSLVALLAVSGAAAQSAPPKPAPKPAPKGGTVAVSGELAKKLKSDDPNEQKAALDEIRVAGRSASHLAGDIAHLLDQGGPKPLTEAAIETLGDLESADAAPAVAAYAVHRDVKIRRLAVQTLVRTKGAAAIKALRARLSDSDAMVRGTAASGLGTLKAREAMPDLFVALDHRVGEAAASIGLLCNPKECDEFATRLGRQPFEVMTGGFDQILFRPTTEVSEDAKIKVIGRVRELGTPDANKFLRDVQKRLPKNASPRIKQAIDQSIAATGGAS